MNKYVDWSMKPDGKSVILKVPQGLSWYQFHIGFPDIIQTTPGLSTLQLRWTALDICSVEPVPRKSEVSTILTLAEN